MSLQSPPTDKNFLVENTGLVFRQWMLGLNNML